MANGRPRRCRKEGCTLAEEGCTLAEGTVFHIRPRHRNEEVREVVPADYGGVLTTDRFRSYDALALARVKQQKCLAHIQRSLSEALVGQRARGRWVARPLKRLLRQAVALWEQQQAGTLSPETFAAARDRLVATVTEHLRPRPLRNDTNCRLLSELGWHHDQGNLLRFLQGPGVEPTNNRAERADSGPK